MCNTYIKLISFSNKIVSAWICFVWYHSYVLSLKWKLLNIKQIKQEMQDRSGQQPGSLLWSVSLTNWTWPGLIQLQIHQHTNCILWDIGLNFRFILELEEYNYNGGDSGVCTWISSKLLPLVFPHHCLHSIKLKYPI